MMEIWSLKGVPAFTDLHKSERDHNDSQSKQCLRAFWGSKMHRLVFRG